MSQLSQMWLFLLVAIPYCLQINATESQEIVEWKLYPKNCYRIQRRDQLNNMVHGITMDDCKKKCLGNGACHIVYYDTDSKSCVPSPDTEDKISTRSRCKPRKSNIFVYVKVYKTINITTPSENTNETTKAVTTPSKTPETILESTPNTTSETTTPKTATLETTAKVTTTPKTTEPETTTPKTTTSETATDTTQETTSEAAPMTTSVTTTETVNETTPGKTPEIPLDTALQTTLGVSSETISAATIVKKPKTVPETAPETLKTTTETTPTTPEPEIEGDPRFMVYRGICPEVPFTSYANFETTKDSSCRRACGDISQCVVAIYYVEQLACHLASEFQEMRRCSKASVVFEKVDSNRPKPQYVTAALWKKSGSDHISSQVFLTVFAALIAKIFLC